MFEDANDFAWTSVKSCNAAVFCRMEEGRLDWANTNELDRCRRHHAQRHPVSKSDSSQNNQNVGQNWEKSDKKVVPCRYYQRNKCFEKRDHDKDNVTYKHVCTDCFAKGKHLRHNMFTCPDRSKN